MLKETPRSLRLYFAAIAFLSLWPVVAALAHARFSSLVSFPMLVNFTVGVVFGFVAIRFDRLLPAPTRIIVMLAGTWILSAIGFALQMRDGTEKFGMLVAAFALSILIVLYLIKSVLRLSKEAHAADA